MNTSISFAFEHELLQKFIDKPGAKRVVFSLRHAPMTAPNSISAYFFTQAYTDTQPIDADLLGVGCPVPPGWQTEDPPGLFTNNDLKLCPKFSADANALRQLLINNKFVGPNGVAQVIATMEGRLLQPGRMTLLLSIKCMNADATAETGNAVDALAFA